MNEHYPAIDAAESEPQSDAITKPHRVRMTPRQMQEFLTKIHHDPRLPDPVMQPEPSTDSICFPVTELDLKRMHKSL